MKEREEKQLDPATAAFLNDLSTFYASIEKLSIPEQRELFKEQYSLPESQLEPVERIEDRVVQGRHGPIPIRLYFPTQEESLPLIIYFHHGGWVYGSVQESEEFCRRLANKAKAVVASVEYRLSPEYKFPIPLEDCYDAARRMIEDSQSPKKVILCGESAGGNLATAVALMALQTKEFTVSGQLLLYPALTNDLVKKDYDSSLDQILITYEKSQYFWEMYLSSPEEGNHPFASPLKSKHLANLPPCLIITAEYDALKHEAAAYKDALQKAGVPVQYKNYPGVLHCFLDIPLAEAVQKEAFEEIAAWVRGL